MSKTTDMTVGSPTRLLLTFSIPLILTNLGQQLYQIVDGAVVGRGIGVRALAAVGATDWSYWLILWAVSALTQGFATFISRDFGKKDLEALNHTIAMSTILCVLLGALFTLAGVAAARPVMLYLQTPEDILPWSVTYLRTMAAGTLIVTGYNMTAAILRALGDGRTPLIAMVIAGVMNILLDLLFVLVFHWGVLGAALATLLAQLFSFLYCLRQIGTFDCVHLHREHWKPDFPRMGRLLAFSFPLAMQNMVVALGGIILQSAINLQGSLFIAGYTATNKLYGLLECSSISLCHAGTTFAAQNQGAGLPHRVRAGLRTCIKISIVLSAVVSVVMIVFGRRLLQLFLDTEEAGGGQALDIAYHYLFIIAVVLFILYLLHCYRSVLQGTGNSIGPMLSGFAEFATRVVMSKVGIHYMGSIALFYAEPLAWIAAVTVLMGTYYLYQVKRL